MGDELNLDNILTGDEFETLFDNEPQETEDTEEKEIKTEEKKETKEKDTTEVDFNSLFEEPESVGSEENNKDKGGASSEKDGTSPNFYSSIARALYEDGTFDNLDDSTLDDVTTPEAFKELIDKQIRDGLDARQKRVDEALSLGIEPPIIKQYENLISQLDGIDDTAISDEGEEGETLRKKLIMQDFINKGFSQERAKRELDKSFKAGTDIEDAKEALKSNKEFFQGAYDKLIQDAKDEEVKERKEREAQAEALKKAIIDDKQLFGDLEIDKATRQKIYDNISKPIAKDPETGELLTAIQKYESENRTEFLKNVSILYTLTDGFKNLDKLVKGKVKKEVKKGIAELEHTLNNTSRTSAGNIRFVGGEDKESAFRGFTIDI